jgi:hypothetical protein
MVQFQYETLSEIKGMRKDLKKEVIEELIKIRSEIKEIKTTRFNRVIESLFLHYFRIFHKLSSLYTIRFHKLILQALNASDSIQISYPLDQAIRI